MDLGICVKLDHCLSLRLRQSLAIVFGTIEMFFFGGIIFGFNALIPVMQREGIYSHLCNRTNASEGITHCSEQTVMYSYALTTYMVVQMVMLFIVGFSVDYLGLRITKFASSLLFSIGAVLFAVANADNSWIIFPAGSFICVGGMAGLICNFSFSKLFTKTSVFVLALITGSYDASSSVFAFFALGYNAGFSYQLTFVLIAAFGLAMNTFSSLFIATYKLPDMSMFLSRNRAGPERTDGSIEESTPLAEFQNHEQKVGEIVHSCYPSVLSSLRSFPFFLITCFFSFAMVRFTFFLTQFGVLTEYQFPESVSTRVDLTKLLSYTLAGGILAGMACGSTIDFLRAQFYPVLSKALSFGASKSVFWLRLCPHAVAMLVVTSSAAILSSLVFLPYVQAYYVNYFFLVIMRGFLFSTISSFIMTAFPIEQFGTLYGVSGSLAGAFSCIQYALLVPNVAIANSICFGFVPLMAIIPIIILSLSSRSWKRRL